MRPPATSVVAQGKRRVPSMTDQRSFPLFISLQYIPCQLPEVTIRPSPIPGVSTQASRGPSQPASFQMTRPLFASSATASFPAPEKTTPLPASSASPLRRNIHGCASRLYSQAVFPSSARMALTLPSTSWAMIMPKAKTILLLTEFFIGRDQITLPLFASSATTAALPQPSSSEVPQNTRPSSATGAQKRTLPGSFASHSAPAEESFAFSGVP